MAAVGEDPDPCPRPLGASLGLDEIRVADKVCCRQEALEALDEKSISEGDINESKTAYEDDEGSTDRATTFISRSKLRRSCAAKARRLQHKQRARLQAWKASTSTKQALVQEQESGTGRRRRQPCTAHLPYLQLSQDQSDLHTALTVLLGGWELHPGHVYRGSLSVKEAELQQSGCWKRALAIVKQAHIVKPRGLDMVKQQQMMDLVSSFSAGPVVDGG